MTNRPTETYNKFDIVLVPFPFIDSASSKQRPALILSSSDSFNAMAGASVMAMVTSATHHPWPLDRPIEDLASAGLPVPSLIRMKL
ncbi:MAG: type II toxin-antitoxin system PemK/MazF family toxin, partial [Parachlamydia sp.]|nr:type II toxin-antitoxin system PemK/MazF family toxin [Parachlamydia sp.]